MVKTTTSTLLLLIAIGSTGFVSGSSDRILRDAASSSSKISCSARPIVDDVLAGVDLVSDPTCTSGAVGCLGTMCHFCKRWETPFSSPLPVCKTDAVQTCAGVRKLKDATLGLTHKNDASCVDGGVGCVRSRCRLCRKRDTPKSMAFVACDSISGGSTIVTNAMAATMAGQDEVADKGLSAWTISLAVGGCAVMAIGGLVFAAKRMTRESSRPDISTPSNSIAYQRASVFHI